MAELTGVDEISQRITAALGERTGTERVAQLLAVALAREDTTYLDLSGLQVGDKNDLQGKLVAVTGTRFLVERVDPDGEGSVVETRPRAGVTGIDYAGPAAAWRDATDELPLPEGSFLTVHFADSSSLRLPTDPAKAVSSAQHDLSELLASLNKQLGAHLVD